MSLSKKISINEIRESDLGEQVSEIADRATDFAAKLANKASAVAVATKEWAAPRLEDAAERGRVAAADAAERSKAAAQDAYVRVRPLVDDATARVEEATNAIREDYLPKAKAAALAASDAALHSEGDLRSRAAHVKEASRKAVAKEEKKSKRKGLLAIAVIGALAGAAYVAWRRSQPIEDPWAEAYWEDVASSDLEDKAEEAVDEAKDAAENVVDDVKDAVEDAVDGAVDIAEDVKDELKS